MCFCTTETPCWLISMELPTCLSSSASETERFWLEQKSKKLRPEHERFLDTTRFDNIPAKFDPNNYDHGQFKYKEKENYCEKCDVYTDSGPNASSQGGGQTQEDVSKSSALPMQSLPDRCSMQGHSGQPYEGKGPHQESEAARGAEKGERCSGG